MMKYTMQEKNLYTFLKDLALSFFFRKDSLVKEIEQMSFDEFKVRARKCDGKVNDLFSYKDPLVKTVVWNMKFRKNKKCFAIAGKLLYEKIIALHIPFPLIIPVPLSSKRKRKRGYNQTEVLGKNIMENDKDNLLESSFSCVTKRHVRTQTSLSRNERRKNLKNSFVVTNPSIIKGRNIIVLDDVITTGATMEEMTKVLLDAGAKRVIPIAFAH